jgi:hypothetical protein
LIDFASPCAHTPGRLRHTAALTAKIAYASSFQPNLGATHLAKPNYAFAKRQRDLAKKQKKEAKRQRKSEPDQTTPTAAGEHSPPNEKAIP